jgi:hypothetical protein
MTETQSTQGNSNQWVGNTDRPCGVPGVTTWGWNEDRDERPSECPDQRPTGGTR